LAHILSGMFRAKLMIVFKKIRHVILPYKIGLLKLNSMVKYSINILNFL